MEQEEQKKGIVKEAGHEKIYNPVQGYVVKSQMLMIPFFKENDG